MTEEKKEIATKTEEASIQNTPAVAVPPEMEEVLILLSFYEEATCRDVAASPEELQGMIMGKFTRMMMSATAVMMEEGQKDVVAKLQENPLIKRVFDFAIIHASKFDITKPEDVAAPVDEPEKDD